MKVLPTIQLETSLDFLQGSFVWPNAWYQAIGRSQASDTPVCRLSFGVSPLNDRIYVDGVKVEDELRRMGYGSALLLAVANANAVGQRLLPITALHETHTSNAFWNALRAGRVPGLAVTLDVRVSEMAEEATRWEIALAR